MPSDDPLLAAYRIIRRLDAPAEAPWPALLAHDANGAVLLVDLPALGADWPGWRAAPDGHLLGPTDLVRHGSGHYAAFPPCGERLDDFLTRRSDAALTDGECLTLAVSALRGLAEAVALPPTVTAGTWWLSDDGRPVFAFDRDGEPIDEAARRLLGSVSEAASAQLGVVLAEAVEIAEEPTRLARSLARLEQDLFSVATPEPLATTVFAPRRARAVTPDAAAAGEPEPAEPPLLARLAAHVDADLADAFSRASTAVWRRFRGGRPTSRRKPLLAAGAIAAAVLAGGLLWPSGGPATAEGGAATPAETSTAPDAVETGPVEDEASAAADATAAPEPSTLEATLDALLTSRAACQDDGCRAALQEDPSITIPPGAVELPSAERTITLLDEFGGAAVLRVDAVAPERGSQLAVIVRGEAAWVLRDVHDVGEHPR